jgi:hypothetical protein
VSSAGGSSTVFRRLWDGANPLILIHFHVVLFGK